MMPALVLEPPQVRGWMPQTGLTTRSPAVVAVADDLF